MIPPNQALRDQKSEIGPSKVVHDARKVVGIETKGEASSWIAAAYPSAPKSPAEVC